MTLSEIDAAARAAARKAWYEARKAYYAAEKAAGRAYRDISRDLPKSLKSLSSFMSQSAKGHKYLSDNAATAKENIRRLTE